MGKGSVDGLGTGVPTTVAAEKLTNVPSTTLFPLISATIAATGRVLVPSPLFLTAVASNPTVTAFGAPAIVRSRVTAVTSGVDAWTIISPRLEEEIDPLVNVVRAIPFASVVTVAGLIFSPPPRPCTMAKLTMTLETGFLPESVTTAIRDDVPPPTRTMVGVA